LAFTGFRDNPDRLIPHPAWRLGLALPMFLIRVWLLRRGLAIPRHGWESVALAASGAAFSWLAPLGLLGLS
jgi:hypothetical protein